MVPKLKLSYSVSFFFPFYNGAKAVCIQEKRNCDLWDKDSSNSRDLKKRQPMLYSALYCQATVFAGFGELQIVFWDRLSLSNPSWPQPRDPLVSASQVTGLQICAITPGPCMNIWLVIFQICDTLTGGPFTVSKKQDKTHKTKKPAFSFLTPSPVSVVFSSTHDKMK